MPRVTATSWTALQDRGLPLRILWEMGSTLRDWTHVADALGPDSMPALCRCDLPHKKLGGLPADMFPLLRDRY
jgi:hypothetical protein